MEMGYTVAQEANGMLRISGVGNTTRQYTSGTYANGKLRLSKPIDMIELKKAIVMANLKKNADYHNWTLRPVDKPFTVDIVKGKDVIRAEVLVDGTIKLTSASKVSAPNHINAEKLVAAIERDAGGKVVVEPMKHGHAHVHEDGTVHTH